MKKTLCAAAILLFSYCGTGTKTERDYTQFVDVFTGTGGHGHTFPGAVRPFGMVQLSPDTHLLGWDASSGYHYGDSVIYAFSHTHLSGTGIGDLGDVALLPYTGSDTMQRPVATFSHAREFAEPGYYRVRLDNFGVDAELTATDRVGVHRYTYPPDSVRRVMLDLAHILQPNWGHRVVSNTFTRISDREVSGTLHTRGWAEAHYIHYFIRFSEPFSRLALLEEGKETAIRERSIFGSDRQVRVYFEFAPSAAPLLVKTALSPVDTAGARANMDAELRGWDFDAVREASHESWRQALDGVRAESADTTVLRNFYTALYHTMIAPTLWQDADGRYKGMDKQIRTAPEGYTNYTVFSLWDTFRAWWPLMTVIDPERAAGFGDVLVQGYREGDILPKWPLASNYTGCMVAYPAVSVLADLQSKGLMRGDPAQWSRAALHSSVYRADLAAKFAGTRELDLITKHVLYKDRYGFVPADSISESVSWGIEMAYDDWCVAQLAQMAGDTVAYADYMKKSDYWRRYFDPETRLMRGVMADGRFREPFNPYYSAHMSSDYTEGTAFQWSFFVPHDMPGFIDALGGAGELESALDKLFTLPSVVEGETASGDITGLIGQYAHGNEPSHHIAYLYNWTESPWKGQRLLDTIMRTFYAPAPEGIIGNEDVGQMSAWYVLSAMGLYQVCPGDPVYALGRPMLDRVLLDVLGGVFEIVAHDNSPQNKYVSEVLLNGKPLRELFLPHSEIKPGGRLEFYMSAVHGRGTAMRFDNKRWNLGKILETDGKVSHTFRFENTGDKPLVINDVSTTCGCAAAGFDREPIMPGGKGRISMTFDPAKRSGAFSANVYVSSNVGRTVLSLSGEVVSRERSDVEKYPFEAVGGVRYSDDELVLGRVGQGKAKSISFGVINTSYQTVTLEAISPKPYIRVQSPVKLGPGVADSVSVMCDLRETEVYGLEEGDVLLSVNGKVAESGIKLRMLLVDDFSDADRVKAPRAIYSHEFEDVGDIGFGKRLVREVILTNKGSNTLIIRSVQDNGNVSTTLTNGQRISPGQTVTFHITLDTSNRGPVMGLVRITQNDPVQTIHEIRLTANVI